VKFLADMGVSPQIDAFLRKHGHEAVRLPEVRLGRLIGGVDYFRIEPSVRNHLAPHPCVARLTQWLYSGSVPEAEPHSVRNLFTIYSRKRV